MSVARFSDPDWFAAPFGHNIGNPPMKGEERMPRGHRFTEKEHRQVEHIKESEEERGMPPEEAERVGYATVNKQYEGQHGKSRYTAKEKRQAEHIAESEEERGKSPEEAKAIGYATVNKRSH